MSSLLNLPQATDLRYFQEVAHALNLSRAAERLGIAQPTLSLAMQRLETAAKIKLLTRSKTGVQLTRAGTRFAAEAQVLLEQWETLVDEAQKDESDVRGRVTIGCHPSVALYALRDSLPVLLSRYPDLEIGLEHDLSRRILERVIRFEIDIGLIINPVRHPDLKLKELLKDEVSLWAIEECANQDVLIFDPELHQAQEIVRRLKRVEGGARQTSARRFRRTIESGNLEVIAGLAAAGAGVAILPGRVATREPAWGLRPYLVGGSAEPKVQDQLYVVTRVGTDRSQTVATVVRGLAAGLAKSKA